MGGSDEKVLCVADMRSSGDYPKDEKQQQSIKEDGAAASPACQTTELHTLRPHRVRFIIPVIVIESLVPGPSAHQRR